MIGRLRGRVAEITPEGLVVDVAGVGYLVQVPHRLADAATIASEITLLIETQVREDAIRLFGFESRQEKTWFRLLQEVQGVGAKVALALISTLTIDDIVGAIALQDAALLARAPGVGPKLAKRIVAELKDKSPLGSGEAPAAAGAPVPTGPGAVRKDAVSALINLGYSPPQAAIAIEGAFARLGPSAGLDALIREGLKALA